ncbi:MAG: hypothetical protein AABW91_00250 [Nanoarchaeota archaeon]
MNNKGVFGWIALGVIIGIVVCIAVWVLIYMTPSIFNNCAKEGEFTSGGNAAPGSIVYGCCQGLKWINEPNSYDMGLLCYDPNKGTPECKGNGWYYPNDGLLLEDNC